ncbi:F-box only protein 30-like [Mya arenaria]|uniref:F-box only protein 30-like n=1 Tax=Mya arenaria TaxID=6604 RepID=UPI0022E54A39|nr:F-box only protein 30-like [Mya arenaria]
MAVHEHCENCFKINCVIKPDNSQSCGLVYCRSDCGFRFHVCKSEEHKLVCMKEKLPCINKINGCPVVLTRDKISAHLPTCPASVIICNREWNRWPMHSQDKGWKAPMPFKHPHIKCGQFDVAFALRDQKMLIESSKTPKKTRRILRNSLTPCYPAVPIQSHSSVLDSPTSETSMLSDDETGTPWDLHQSPPGLQSTIVNQLSGMQSSEERNLYAASRQATESLTRALDYATGKQGLKRLAEISKLKYDKLDKEEKNVEQITEDMKNTSICDRGHHVNDSMFDNSCSANGSSEDDDMLELYGMEKKLYEILGLDLTMQFISSYQPKPMKMFTFLCGREFRRDEYPWHVKNFHCDIQCNLNNWFEQRCPLAYLGCTFAFQRLVPKSPSGSIVHSPVLNSFGLSFSEEYVPDKDHCNGQLTNEEDIRTVFGRKLLREATPEIHTSYKCDASVHVIPRYRSVSRDVSPVKFGANEYVDEYQHSLVDLPFEVLQNIARHLDGFSLQHMSMTCKLIQSVCCSLLDEKGIVTLVWEKTASDSGSSFHWDVAYKKWQFSTGFTPVIEWDLKGAGAAIQEHLKMCPYNQEEYKNIQTEPFQMLQ